MPNIRIEVNPAKEKQFIVSYVKGSEKELEKVLFTAANNTRTNAIKSIQSSSSKGESYKRGNVVHVASTAGNAPNTDTGNLVSNITVRKNSRFDYDAGSRSGAPYGFWLEFGTSNMEPRPWLTPAFEEAIRDLKGLL